MFQLLSNVFIYDGFKYIKKQTAVFHSFVLYENISAISVEKRNVRDNFYIISKTIVVIFVFFLIFQNTIRYSVYRKESEQYQLYFHLFILIYCYFT